jgi:Zn-dependent oligopeptidase
MPDKIEIEALRAAVLRECDIALSSTDPIFACVALNEIMLARYIRQVEIAIETERNSASAATVQQLTTSKEVAERLITQAGDFIQVRTIEAFETASKRLSEQLDKHLSTVGQRLLISQRLQRVAIGTASVGIAMMCVTFGFLLGHAS